MDEIYDLGDMEEEFVTFDEMTARYADAYGYFLRKV